MRASRCAPRPSTHGHMKSRPRYQVFLSPHQLRAQKKSFPDHDLRLLCHHRAAKALRWFLCEAPWDEGFHSMHVPRRHRECVSLANKQIPSLDPYHLDGWCGNWCGNKWSTDKEQYEFLQKKEYSSKWKCIVPAYTQLGPNWGTLNPHHTLGKLSRIGGRFANSIRSGTCSVKTPRGRSQMVWGCVWG